jgi:pimeloyl-ACP methyl ester carboxylesterase
LNKNKQLRESLAGILLLVIGGALALVPARRYTEHRYVVDSASCRMNLVVVSRADLLASPNTGAVVLLHGLSASSLIMEYLARAFANQGLTVFIPDLPGHGRSPGPFSPDKAESCAASLLRGLEARGMIVPDRTILTGHSMGGAIALRLADKFRPAGVIAISPAPMIPTHGVISQNLLYHTLPLLVPNTLVMAGQFEPAGLAANAQDLATKSPYPSWVKFTLIPWNTHVGMLFSSTVASEAQEWAAKALNLPTATQVPSRSTLIACVLGLIGVVLLAGPFLREMVGKEEATEGDTAAPTTGNVHWLRGALEVLLLSAAAVGVLRYWIPLRVLHLFEGDYLASFFLILGLGLILLHLKPAWDSVRTRGGVVLGAAIAGLLLLLLVTGWFALTSTGTWLTWQRWARFPLFLLAVFVFFYGVEIIAGPVVQGRVRYAFWCLLMVLAWLALTFGLFYLRSGEILLVLLSPYFGVELLLSGLGIQLVRRVSGSSPGAALFGAILLAGFCLVIFPLT